MLLIALVSFVTGIARSQTLARPGWAGSGMTIERWWPHAVVCEMRPDSLVGEAAAAEGSALHRLGARLDDLQTLGVDAVLLREIETNLEPKVDAARGAVGGGVEIDRRYGTPNDFDELVSDAVRHGIRVLVELHGGAQGTSLTDDARFWLNHGVTGLALPTDDPVAVRAIRGVLRGYVGERVLIGENEDRKSFGSPQPSAAQSQIFARRAERHTGASAPSNAEQANHPDQPDLVLVRLPPVEQGAAAMRGAVEAARAMMANHAPVPMLTVEQGRGESAGARVLATALLGSGAAVLVRADDLDLAHADRDLTPGSIFAWYRQWSGLHRGNAAMRSGEMILLDHDAEGALVWVRQSRGGGAPIIAICNVTDKPLRLSLVMDIQRLKLRGSFLRTVARSDGGMGAMPLREIVLPPFAVYAGELSR